MATKEEKTNPFTQETGVIHLGGIDAIVRLTLDQVRTANGEESFDDTDGDNLYKPATENHRRLGDAYVDNNEDGVWTSPEQYFPFAGSIDNANTGASCPTDYVRYGNAKSKADTCNTTWGQAQVRRDQVIVLSAMPFITFTPRRLTAIWTVARCMSETPLEAQQGVRARRALPSVSRISTTTCCRPGPLSTSMTTVFNICRRVGPTW